MSSLLFSLLCPYLTLSSLLTPLQPHWPICCYSVASSLFLPQGLYICCAFFLGFLGLLTSKRLSFMSLMSLLKHYLFREAFPDHFVYNSQFSIILYFLSLFNFDNIAWGFAFSLFSLPECKLYECNSLFHLLLCPE